VFASGTPYSVDTDAVTEAVDATKVGLGMDIKVMARCVDDGDGSGNKVSAQGFYLAEGAKPRSAAFVESVVQAFLASEVKFCRQLTALVLFFVKPLQSRDAEWKRALLDKPSVAAVLHEVVEMRALSMRLRDKLARWDGTDVVALAALLRGVAPNLANYSAFQLAITDAFAHLSKAARPISALLLAESDADAQARGSRASRLGSVEGRSSWGAAAASTADDYDDEDDIEGVPPLDSMEALETALGAPKFHCTEYVERRCCCRCCCCCYCCRCCCYCCWGARLLRPPRLRSRQRDATTPTPLLLLLLRTNPPRLSGTLWPRGTSGSRAPPR